MGGEKKNVGGRYCIRWHVFWDGWRVRNREGFGRVKSTESRRAWQGREKYGMVGRALCVELLWFLGADTALRGSNSTAQ